MTSSAHPYRDCEPLTDDQRYEKLHKQAADEVDRTRIAYAQALVTFREIVAMRANERSCELHRRMHSEAERFWCGVCLQGWPTREGLDAHRRAMGTRQ